MNPVLVLTHNNRNLTERCIASIQTQDIPTWTYLVDNDSNDQTYEWAKTVQNVVPVQFRPQIGVSGGWNHGLKFLFECEDAEHVLVVGNDAVLPPFFYRELLSYNVPFISGVDVEDIDQIASLPKRTEPVTHPSFSAFVIRRDCWNTIGPFDESMFSWASDCDYHVRAHRLGINLLMANVPFYHIRSRTIELALPREKRMMELQADADRLAFFEKWKVEVWSPRYADLFDPEAFGIDRKDDNNA